MDYKVHGILQTRLLEWVAFPFSRGSSQPRDRTCISYVPFIDSWVLYHKLHLGSPYYLRKDLQEPLFAQAGKSCSQEVRQVSLLQRKRSLTVPGGAGCQSV